MTQQTNDGKFAALNELYSRITRIAEAMGGTASPVVLGLSLPSAVVATPRSEDAPALGVEMPGGFQVDFAPAHPLSIGNALSVRARRTHRGGRKNDWIFTFIQDVWRYSQNPLSDEEIRKCLTPDGPPPPSY